ncbi:hydroxyethylthiazole kinase [Piscibacillus sp. B03]|uniref:hydroxyethylthiazole kinase n=1 Tax=Piscibacillus sp. B03 TaxID=3457430 RepID=UPI003FCD6B18
MISSVIDSVRKKGPLIHHITNQVVMNFSANGLLAFGGTPIMAKESKEVSEIVDVADGLLLNIGTAVENDYKSMLTAGKRANEKGFPIVLDPVGVGVSEFRREYIRQLLKEVTPTVIKGNAAEIAYFAEVNWEAKGVDATGSGNVVDVAQGAFEKYGCPIVLTGQQDVIVTSKGTQINDTGSEFLAKITGAGCLLGSIITACITVEGDLDEQLYSAVHFYGLAAEYTSRLSEVTGPGTFLSHFIDALSYDISRLERGS